MGDVCRQFFRDGYFQFIIQHIAFTNSNDEVFLQQFGIIFLQLIQQDSKFSFVVVAIGRNQE